MSYPGQSKALSQPGSTLLPGHQSVAVVARIRNRREFNHRRMPALSIVHRQRRMGLERESLAKADLPTFSSDGLVVDSSHDARFYYLEVFEIPSKSTQKSFLPN